MQNYACARSNASVCVCACVRLRVPIIKLDQPSYFRVQRAGTIFELCTCEPEVYEQKRATSNMAPIWSASEEFATN